MTLPLGPGAEFDLLRTIFERIRTGDRDGARGLGDDCALLRIGGTTLAISVDLSVEGVHFRTEWLSFEEIGWRAAAAALSDLAAEGAKPIGVLASVGVRGRGKGEGGRDDAAVDIMAGVAAAARAVGARVLGGDLTRSDRYLVDVCVLGTATRPVRRRGARAGDGVWVTGTLGGAALALERFRAGAGPSGPLRQRFARPEPRVAAGRWLARRGAHAMIDVSDGLTADAQHLAYASGVALELELERMPCWPGVAPRDAVASGEEYELLVALPRRFSARDAATFARAHELALTCIGRCASGAGVRLTDGGAVVPVPSGFDHFAAR
jgi:thiamine-monophosphate kinase